MAGCLPPPILLACVLDAEPSAAGSSCPAFPLQGWPCHHAPGQMTLLCSSFLTDPQSDKEGHLQPLSSPATAFSIPHETFGGSHKLGDTDQLLKGQNPKLQKWISQIRASRYCMRQASRCHQNLEGHLEIA